MELYIGLKPLTVNQAWQGERYKTPKYRVFTKEFWEKTLHFKRDRIPGGDLEVHYKFYLKHFSTTDVDNLIKCAQDCLVHCGFIKDDKFIVRIIAEKFKDKNERIEVSIKSINLDIGDKAESTD